MSRRASTRAVGLVLLGALVPALVSGCGSAPYPPDHLPLPGLAGRGEGAYTVTVELPDAENLVANQNVRLHDVVVGNIESLTFENWHAKAVMRLNGDTRLPVGTTAKVAQKSLLGAEFLELTPPPGGQPGSRMLRDGDVIALDRSGRYPETEEVLAALSTVLNGGGLNQLKTINTELAAALTGHEGQAKELIHTLSAFAGTLDNRKADIVRAIEGIDRLSVRLNQDSAVVAHAVDTLPGGLAELNSQRKDLVDALDAVSKFGDVAKKVVDKDKDDLVDNLRHLEPILKKLADSGNNLTDSLSGILSPPFPVNTAYPTVMRGDYGNLFAIFDVQPITLLRNFCVISFLGGPLQGCSPPLGLLTALPPMGASLPLADPLTTPFGKLPAAGDAPKVPLDLGPPDPAGGLLSDRHDGPSPSHDGPSTGGLFGSLHGGR